jgi:hypothetical protein
MKKQILIISIFGILFFKSYGQNSPFCIYGTGLDGTTYQKTAIYTEASCGLLFEAPLDASGNRLPITFSWRGGGSFPLYIKSDGKIGIGTTQPSEMLHIKGTTSSEIRLESDNGSVNIRQTGTNLDFYNNGERLTILNNGNIGIGITQPSSNLHINNLVGQTVVSLSSNNIKYGAILQLERFNSSGNYFSFETGAGTNDDLRLYVNNNWTVPIVTYKTNGTVGIGTASPDSRFKLDVEGTIRASEGMLTRRL